MKEFAVRITCLFAGILVVAGIIVMPYIVRDGQRTARWWNW